MSAEAVGWVFRHSPFKGAAFAVHQAIADSVNDQNGNEFWMASPNLAVKARVSERAARGAIATLVEKGYIEPVDATMFDPTERQRAGRPARYRFLFPDDAPVVYETRKRAMRDTPMVGSDGKAVGWRGPAGSADPSPERDAQGSAQVAEGCEATADVTQEEPKGDPKGSPDGGPIEKVSARRPRFPEFDALVAVWGEPGTREEAAFYARTARSLAGQGKTPEEIIERGTLARRRHEQCTVNVLLTRWSQFAPKERPRSKFDAVAAADRGRLG